MMKEFKKKVYTIKVYGEKVELAPPTFGEMLKFEKEVTTKPDAIFDFLEARGLSKVLAESMYMEDLMELLAMFREKKR